MTNKKLTGSFYTPKIVADFLIDYLSSKISSKKLSILEPSVGDGVFVSSIYNNVNFSHKVNDITVIERDNAELAKVRAITNDKKLNTIHSDFLDFQSNINTEYDLVIGNPPYIKKGLLTNKQIEACEKIHQLYSSLSNNKIKNIWTAFLIRSINLVKNDGALAMVLPSELLQVKYAAELRELIIREFERVEIFTFNELLFNDSKGQDTLLLIAERKSKNKGVYYCNIDKVSDLNKRNFHLVENINIKESKWTHHHLTTDEIELLEKFKEKLDTINTYCTSKAGVVTGANDYFIVDINTVERYSMKKYVKEIIQKGVFINGSVTIESEDFEKLVEGQYPTYLLVLNSKIKIKSNEKINKYFDQGVLLDIDKRYKTSIRDTWYEVPNVAPPAEAFFFKRCNQYPKFIKNNANVLVTDSAYMISMREEYNIESLIYSFYNSLSLSFAELNGRYYGGGSC